jgi:hypothetical protein
VVSGELFGLYVVGRLCVGSYSSPLALVSVGLLCVCGVFELILFPFLT